MISLGPNLSFNLPITMDNNPFTSKASEYVDDVTALVKPNSVSNGSKNIPKLRNIPQDITIIQVETKTTT